jgi:DNA replicative helicase MCM subunit Mcm2 (Cdc46/Mcm family)
MDLESQLKGDMEMDLFKKYIAYAKAKVSPRLTEQSAEKIKNLYVKDR